MRFSPCADGDGKLHCHGEMITGSLRFARQCVAASYFVDLMSNATG